MCSKPKAPKPAAEKPVQYLANPLLDGLSIGTERGRNALRIDRAPSAGSHTPIPFEGTGGVGGPGSPGGHSPKRSGARGMLPLLPGLLIPNRGNGGGKGSPRFNLF